MSDVQVPPCNIEAEESVLGAMMVAEPTLPQVIDEVGLQAEDFYLDKHRLTFEAIRDLYTKGNPAAALAVSNELQRRGKVAEPGSRKKIPAIEAAGGKHYVTELEGKCPAAANAKHYAEIVREKSRLRQVIGAAQEAQAAAYSGEVNGEVDGLVTALTIAKVGASEITTVKGSEVTLRSPRFLDEQKMIPTRSVTVVFGKGGLGKTLFAINRAAAVTRGEMVGLDGPAPVLVSSQEDDAEAVLAPRAVAAGADLEQLHFVSGLTLPSQVPALLARAKTLGAAMIVIDPIGEHLDSEVDSHKEAAVRNALRPLAEGAQALDLTVLVVCHPNKNTGATGLDRISGSGAFGNTARSVIVFGLDPGDPDGETGDRRVIGHMKCNVGKRAPSIAAEILTGQVETSEGAAIVPRLSLTGLSDHSADDLLSSPSSEERSERDEARLFLTELLAGGPVRTNEIKTASERAGIASWRTVERAKKDLGLKAAQGGDGWYWLPEGRSEL
jgi:KaiC/GvpD/RAD55 family RecA-like ATPase